MHTQGSRYADCVGYSIIKSVGYSTSEGWVAGRE